MGHAGGGQFLHSNNDKTSQFNTRQAKGVIAAAEQKHTDLLPWSLVQEEHEFGEDLQSGVKKSREETGKFFFLVFFMSPKVL